MTDAPGITSFTSLLRKPEQGENTPPLYEINEEICCIREGDPPSESVTQYERNEIDEVIPRGTRGTPSKAGAPRFSSVLAGKSLSADAQRPDLAARGSAAVSPRVSPAAGDGRDEDHDPLRCVDCSAPARGFSHLCSRCWDRLDADRRARRGMSGSDPYALAPWAPRELKAVAAGPAQAAAAAHFRFRESR